MELITGENDNGRRLDRILRKALPDYPLPLIHRFLRQEKVLINGKPGKARDRVDAGVKIVIPSMRETDNNFAGRKKKIRARINIKTRGRQSLEEYIIWQNDDLIAFNKPKGLAVHGRGSLETMARDYLIDKIPASLSFTSGPLHRLDKPSSGIVVFSKSLEGARLFSSLMRERKIKKTYLAIVEGNVERDEIWKDALFRDKEIKKTIIRGSRYSKDAVTKIVPLAAKDMRSLIKAQIITGRTHQIRAQAAFHGHPLAGDVKYGGQSVINNRQLKSAHTKEKNYIEKKPDFFLHAWKLEFPDVFIEAPPPEDFIKMIELIFEKNVLDL